MSKFGKCTVCLDGYQTMSTKVVEQNRRTLCHNVSADIVVDKKKSLPISVFFLANRKNNSRLKEEIKFKLSTEGVTFL